MCISLDKSQKRPENPDRLIDYKSQRETMKTALGFGKSRYDLQLIRWCLEIKTFVSKILLIDIKVLDLTCQKKLWEKVNVQSMKFLKR